MRERLVEVAARLLAEQGREAVSARRLASEVGASTQVLYTHFDGVEQLLAEVWREGFRRFGQALDQPARTADPVADWMAQGWGYRRFALRNPHLYRVMFGDDMLTGRPSDDDAAIEVASGTFLSLLTRIERCRDAGRWALEDLFAAGEVVWATSHGHASIELSGYFDAVRRDPAAAFDECLLRLALGFGDHPEPARRSLVTARRRARDADRN
jgi:AcrR family transcriptional regulator